MLNIAICDDNALHNELVNDLLNEYIQSRRTAVRSAVFLSGEALLENVKANGGYDIYLLDMIMPEMNGMDTAAALRGMGDEGKVIFLTSTLDYALESYEVQAFYYLLKPVDTEKLFSVLDRAAAQLTHDEAAAFTLRTRDGEKRILLDHLMYVDVFNRCLQFHMDDGKVVEGMTMRVTFREAVSELLGDERFHLCGSRSVVNLSLVDTVGKEETIFRNGDSFFPARSSVADLLAAWQRYLKKGE